MTAATAHGVAVATVDAVPDGAVHPVTVEGRAIVLVNTGGELFALDATCTHAGGPLAEGRLVGGCLRCPWHGAAFDVRSGDPRGAPARKPVRRHDVQVRAGTIFVRLDRA